MLNVNLFTNQNDRMLPLTIISDSNSDMMANPGDMTLIIFARGRYSCRLEIFNLVRDEHDVRELGKDPRTVDVKLAVH